MTNLIPPPVGPPLESGAYHRPSRSTRWKFPVPPSGPPLCEMPIECIVPAVGNGRAIRVSRITQKPDPKSPRLNSSHSQISFAVLFLEKQTPRPLHAALQSRTSLLRLPLRS